MNELLFAYTQSFNMFESQTNYEMITLKKHSAG